MSRVKFHHINLTAAQVPVMTEFYRSVLEIDENSAGVAANRMTDEYSAPVAFLDSDGVEMHLATMDLGLGHRLTQAVKPLSAAVSLTATTTWRRSGPTSRLSVSRIPRRRGGGCAHHIQAYATALTRSAPPDEVKLD